MKSGMIKAMVGVGALLAFSQEVLACPSCKEGFKAGSPEAAAGDAFSASVIFMLVVPTLIVATFTVVIAKKLKTNSDNK